MSRRRGLLVAGLLLGTLVGVGVTVSTGWGQIQKSPAPETLLPANTLLYFGWDGVAAHQAAWEQTAAHQAVFKTKLGQIVSKLLDFAEQQPGGEQTALVRQSVAHIHEHGLFVSVASGTPAGIPLPRVTIVVPEAAGSIEALNSLVEQATGGEVPLEQVKIGKRAVTRAEIPTIPGAELGWWAEGNHLVIAGGIGALQTAVSVAEGKVPHFGTTDLWKESREADFDVALTSLLDFPGLRQLVGAFPLPTQNPEQQSTVDDLLTELGLDTLGPVSYRWGFRGQSLWSETNLVAPAPRKGLLAFGDQPALTLDSLPPLPADGDGFYATTVNWSGFYSDGIKLALAVSRIMGNTDPELAELAETLPEKLGFDPQADLFDTLGQVVTLYSDPQGLFGFGFGLAFEVKDAKTLRTTLTKLLEVAERETQGKVQVRTSEQAGRSIQYLTFTEAPVITPALTVDDKWLVIGLSPQTVEGFLLRLDGTLPKWEPGEMVQAGLKELPESFLSLSVADPRGGLKSLLSFAPMMISGVEMAVNQQRRMQGLPPNADFPLTPADVPVTETVVQPLFPNLSTCSADEHGIRWTSRSSLPAIPLLSSVSGAGYTAPVLLALLLPAVQQAREAARRTQSRNNLKQLGLSLHNYESVHQQLVKGTITNKELKPEKRLSWMVEVLPFLDEGGLYEQIDRKQSWDSDDNAEPLKRKVSIFLNPQVSEQSDTEYGVTHYVGIGGVGEDAATLKKDDPKAGIFGYTRTVKFADIRDGTSNTMAIIEASGDYGPWGAGGQSTIRSLTTKPYINGPDKIGGPFTGVVNVMMMDGSVRAISTSIDPETLEALATMAGGETVGDF